MLLPRAMLSLGRSTHTHGSHLPPHLPPHRPLAASLPRRLSDLKSCQTTETFDHGEFKIEKASKLGTLLELEGPCAAPPSDAKNDAAKMVGAGAIHLAVRGIVGDLSADEVAAKINALRKENKPAKIEASSIYD